MSEKNECDKLSEFLKINNPDVATKILTYHVPEPSCVVDYSDQALDKDLKESDKAVGGWSTTGSIAIRNLGENSFVESSDIPINMQTCERIQPLVRRSLVTEIDLERMMPKTCKLVQIHLHDGRDNQSTHLRIKCERAGDEELRFLANLVFESQVIGRTICRGVRKDMIREQMFFEARERIREKEAGI